MDEYQNGSVHPAGRRELGYALGLVGLSVFTVNSVLNGGFRLGFALGVSGILLLTVWYLAEHLRFCISGGFYLLASLGMAGCFGWSQDGAVKFFLLFLMLLAWYWGLTLMTGRSSRDPGGVTDLLDVGFTALLLPFQDMSGTLRGLSYRQTLEGMARRKTGGVLLGGALAIPVLAVVLPLLISSDAAFEGLMARTVFADLGELLLSLGFGAALFVPIFSRGVSLRRSVPEEKKEVQPYEGRASAITVGTLLGIVSFFYGLYLLSQLAYFFSAFSGILPEGFTSAQYARRGFFEMCALCAINLGLVALACGLVRRKEGRVPLSTRLLSLFVCLFCLVLVAASGSKMALYIGNFGLTRLRVLTSVFMVCLGAGVICVGIWLMKPGFPYMKVIPVVVLLAAILTGWADVDTQVARYNVEAYRSGVLAQVDLDTLANLSGGATPYLACLLEDSDPEVAQGALEILADRALTLYDLRVDATGQPRFVPRDRGFQGWCRKEAAELEILEPLLPELLPLIVG